MGVVAVVGVVLTVGLLDTLHLSLLLLLHLVVYQLLLETVSEVHHFMVFQLYFHPLNEVLGMGGPVHYVFLFLLHVVLEVDHIGQNRLGPRFVHILHFVQ